MQKGILFQQSNFLYQIVKNGLSYQVNFITGQIYNFQISIISKNMGKSQRKSSVQDILSHNTHQVKSRKYASMTVLNEKMELKPHIIRHNFRRMINRLLSEESKAKKETYIASFLNIIQSMQEICSLGNIPSIENMISQKLIKEQEESCQSITEPLQSALLIAEPELPVYFMSLLQKVFSLIGMPLTKKQNQYVIKGTWNIMVKYWRDRGYLLYKINQKIEWGLLELLGFKFITSKRQRFQAQELLRKTLKEIQKPQQNILPESERSWGCTLENIE